MDVAYNTQLKKKLLSDPVFAQKVTQFKTKEIFKDEFFTNSPPSVFVGSKLYPEANIGVLSPPEKKENVWIYDAQKYWAEKNFDIFQILEYRSSLINSRFRTTVKSARNKEERFISLAREIGMSNKPVDAEMKLKKKIKLRLYVDDTALPLGATGTLEKLSIGNTKISQHVDKVYFDSDLKAVDGILYLKKHGYDEQKLSQLLSIGVLGQEKKRVFVPTRWSITATDDILGKQLLNKIRDYSFVFDYQLYTGCYLGNYYFVLLFPYRVQYELFETYMPGSFWNPSKVLQMSHDHEGFKGRTSYASNTAGGYYASRLGVLELLERIKRQASALVFRFETPDYWAGLGVFVVREAMRKTLQTKPFIFDSQEQLVAKLKELIFKQFHFPMDETLNKSKILESFQQKTLSNYF